MNLVWEAAEAPPPTGCSCSWLIERGPYCCYASHYLISLQHHCTTWELLDALRKPLAASPASPGWQTGLDILICVCWATGYSVCHCLWAVGAHQQPLHINKCWKARVISPTLLISKLRGDRAAARSVLPWDSLGVYFQGHISFWWARGVESGTTLQNTADTSAVSLQRFTETQPGALGPEELQSCIGPHSLSCSKATTKCLGGENSWWKWYWEEASTDYFLQEAKNINILASLHSVFKNKLFFPYKCLKYFKLQWIIFTHPCWVTPHLSPTCAPLLLFSCTWPLELVFEQFKQSMLT